MNLDDLCHMSQFLAVCGLTGQGTLHLRHVQRSTLGLLIVNEVIQVLKRLSPGQYHNAVGTGCKFPFIQQSEVLNLNLLQTLLQ